MKTTIHPYRILLETGYVKSYIDLNGYERRKEDNLCDPLWNKNYFN